MIHEITTDLRSSALTPRERKNFLVRASSSSSSPFYVTFELSLNRNEVAFSSRFVFRICPRKKCLFFFQGCTRKWCYPIRNGSNSDPDLRERERKEGKFIPIHHVFGEEKCAKNVKLKITVASIAFILRKTLQQQRGMQNNRWHNFWFFASQNVGHKIFRG